MPKTLKSYPHATWADFNVGADGNSPFRRHEKLAALCMEAIASRSQAETHLLRAAVAMLGGPGAPEAVAYAQSTKQSDKEKLIKEKGLPRLPEPDQDVFRCIRSKLEQHGFERNNLAHGFWGDTGAIPDALLRIDARDVPLAFPPRGLADFNNNIRGWGDKVRVYKEADFARMTKNNALDASLLAGFHAMLVYGHGRSGDWHRDRLVADLAGN